MSIKSTILPAAESAPSVDPVYYAVFVPADKKNPPSIYFYAKRGMKMDNIGEVEINPDEVAGVFNAIRSKSIRFQF